MKVEVTRLLPCDQPRHAWWYRKGLYATGFLLAHSQLNLSALTLWMHQNAAGLAPSCKNKPWFPNRGNMVTREPQRLQRGPQRGASPGTGRGRSHQLRKNHSGTVEKMQVKPDKTHLSNVFPPAPRPNTGKKSAQCFMGKQSPKPVFLQDHRGYPKVNKQGTGVANASNLIFVLNTPTWKLFIPWELSDFNKKHRSAMADAASPRARSALHAVCAGAAGPGQARSSAPAARNHQLLCWQQAHLPSARQTHPSPSVYNPEPVQ